MKEGYKEIWGLLGCKWLPPPIDTCNTGSAVGTLLGLRVMGKGADKRKGEDKGKDISTLPDYSVKVSLAIQIINYFCK